MTHRLLNSIKWHAASQDQSAPVPRWGIVTGANTATMTVKVELQPEGVPTDWLPLASSMVGGGWGLIHVPPNGTQVLCVPDSGDHTNYIVVGATWSTASMPPENIGQGELWMVHSSGSSIKLTNDGKVSIANASGCSLAFNNNGTATLTGELNVTGNVVWNFGGGSQADAEGHEHNSPANGGRTTPPIVGT